MLEIDGKSYEVHKVKLTKKDLKNLKKGETLIFICKEDKKAITVKQIETIAKTYDVNPAWLVGWIDDETMPAIQVLEKVVYKESPTARLPDYHNNNNDGKIIKWVKSKRYMGGKVWSKRT